MVLDRSGVAEREAQHELEPGHVAEEAVHAGGLPAALTLAFGKPERSLLPVLVFGRPTAGSAAADQRPGAGRRGGGDEILVPALYRRVGDLEHVEHAHGDLAGQVREDPRHPDEADLPLLAQRHQRLDGPGRRHLGGAGRHVHLDQVQPVGAEPAQALLDPGPDVAAAVVVRERRPGIGRRVAEQTSALGRQEVVLPAVAEIPADELLAAAVVDRGVDQVDTPIEHRVEQPARVLILDRRAARLAPQLHRPVPEDGHLRPGPPQNARLDRHGPHVTGGRQPRCRPPPGEASVPGAAGLAVAPRSPFGPPLGPPLVPLGPPLGPPVHP